MRTNTAEAPSAGARSALRNGPRRRSGDAIGLRTIVVVPCFNEAARLDPRRFIEHARREENVGFLMVNDGSRDETELVLSGMAKEMPRRFRVLNLERNSGKAEAVRRGICLALEDGPDVVGYWDADLATPLDAIHDLLRTLQRRPEVEIVIGSRVKLLGRHIDRRPVRHYAGRVFATLTSLALRLPVYDTQCGAKLFRCTSHTEDYFSKPFASRWIFDVEILARALSAPGRRHVLAHEDGIVEYPLLEWRDVTGSKLKAHDFVVAMGELCRIWAQYRP